MHRCWLANFKGKVNFPKKYFSLPISAGEVKRMQMIHMAYPMATAFDRVNILLYITGKLIAQNRLTAITKCSQIEAKNVELANKPNSRAVSVDGVDRCSPLKLLTHPMSNKAI